MKTLDIAKAVGSLAEYARAAGEEPVVLTDQGRPIAVLVPVRGADLESLALGTHPQFVALIERSRARQKAEGGLSTRAVRHRLGLKG